MSGADLLVDGFPHGTTAGYRQGCRSAGGCPTAYGQTCARAQVRASSDFQYGKAVGKGREVEFLEREEAARAEVAKPTVKRWPVPVARPKLPAPTPVVAEQEVEPAAPAEPKSSASPAKSQGVLVSHPKQRDHALATASEEHPMGLTLGGEPRRRCAPGTVLVHGVLQATKAWPRVDAEATTEQPAEPVVVAVQPDWPEPDPVEVPAAAEEPRPRGKRVLDDAVQTLAESLELQRAIAEIGERALRTIRIEINHMRRDAAALENQQEKR